MYLIISISLLLGKLPHLIELHREVSFHPLDFQTLEFSLHLNICLFTESADPPSPLLIPHNPVKDVVTFKISSEVNKS